MGEYTATVTEFIERPEIYSNGTPAKSLGGIIVRPPLHTGEAKAFKSAILGETTSSSGETRSNSVDVREVVTTSEATLFLAESGRGRADSRQADIRTMADRILRLANNPASVVQMIDETPFPRTDDEW